MSVLTLFISHNYVYKCLLHNLVSFSSLLFLIIKIRSTPKLRYKSFDSRIFFRSRINNVVMNPYRTSMYVHNHYKLVFEDTK